MEIKYNGTFIATYQSLQSRNHPAFQIGQGGIVPHSACFKFDLNASKRVKELASKQNKALVEQADIALLLFKSAAKKQIIQLIELEILTTKQAIPKLFSDATGFLACTFAIHHSAMENYKATALIYLIFDHYHQRLLEYSEILPGSPQHFFNFLHEVHPMPSGIYEYQLLKPHNITTMEPAKECIRDLLNALFYCSWNAYLAAKMDNLHQLVLQ
jgi:hypothetical protein